MIVLFTDFGVGDPYVGQLHAVLAQAAPGVPVIDLLHTVPAFDIAAAAYLLPALAARFPPGAVFVCVVDPGVGGARQALALKADGRWYVGPDNGLFTLLARRAKTLECHAIRWRPAQLSASFHGRDLFAPVAARLARGELPPTEPGSLTVPVGDWPDDAARIIYIDHYGNATTGLRAASVPLGRRLVVAGRELAQAGTFGEVPPGTPFWYVNSIDLVEVAANQASAAQLLGLRVGDALTLCA